MSTFAGIAAVAPTKLGFTETILAAFWKLILLSEEYDNQLEPAVAAAFFKAYQSALMAFSFVVVTVSFLLWMQFVAFVPADLLLPSVLKFARDSFVPVHRDFMERCEENVYRFIRLP